MINKYFLMFILFILLDLIYTLCACNVNSSMCILLISAYAIVWLKNTFSDMTMLITCLSGKSSLKCTNRLVCVDEKLPTNRRVTFVLLCFMRVLTNCKENTVIKLFTLSPWAAITKD